MVELARAQRIGKKYQNPVPTELGGLKLMLKVLPRYLFKAKDVEPKGGLGPFPTDPSAYRTPPISGLRVTWFGHSCLLLEIDGVRLLVDPVWDERASPFRHFGPRRFFPPTLPLDKLPPIDAVVISHDHYDHMGAETVKALAAQRPQLRWVTSLGVGAELQSMGVTAGKITELNWTESTPIRSADFTSEVKVISLPARHFSGRSAFNRNQTLWSSFAFAGGRHRLYHGVDSGLWDGYEAIGAKYGPFDLTLLEIGAYNELWGDIHLGPDNAARAFHAMRSGGLMMPVHWGLFNLALHPWRQPIERFRELADEQQIALFLPPPGLPTEVVAGRPVLSDWYRASR